MPQAGVRVRRQAKPASATGFGRYSAPVAEQSNEPVLLTVVLNEIEADQIQSLLKFEGIESMQRPTDVGAGSIGGSGAMSGSREILVKPEDLESAKAIIGEE